MLSELLYISFRNSSCTSEEVEKILKQSIQNNGKKNITGVLLYSKVQFLQVLEGDNEQIVTLYDKIKTDSRHDKALMLSLKPIKERFFPSWQMAGKEMDSGYQFLSTLQEEEKKEFQQILEGETNSNAVKIISRLFND
ncbi:BLUF domain-containing protein [Microscilla marina]|uniref:Activator of photopigment and puc expression n=1 Tax=Microscilla marina ATCC 23134 TaxID=313606 RepID=A1ZRF7_MICM2|nr:BLUF domain-containing protein [Microscilla marina]EAY27047.1 activator of photopigment and puc expression [Microscilla marina ATCC 23134]